MNEHQEFIIDALNSYRINVSLTDKEIGQLDAAIEWVKAQGWRPISEAPKSEHKPFLVQLPGNDMADYIVMQVSNFEGRMYPDARDGCIDWEDGITNAVAWRPLPEPMKTPQLPE